MVEPMPQQSSSLLKDGSGELDGATTTPPMKAATQALAVPLDR
jgi:hypothetical protein